MNNYTKNILQKDLELSYDNNGNIEILVSPGYGAGWSTWDYDYGVNLALDKRIIDFYKKYGQKASKEQLEEFLKNIGYENVFYRGWDQVQIFTVPKNCKFKIKEYDGYEELISFASDNLLELP